MNAVQHLVSMSAGAVVTGEVLTTQDIPDSKEKVIALLTAVVVQSVIFGLTEFRKFLQKRNQKKVAQT